MVHADCRKRFTDKQKSVDSQPQNSKRLRPKFMWKTLCFYCEKDYQPRLQVIKGIFSSYDPRSKGEGFKTSIGKG